MPDQTIPFAANDSERRSPMPLQRGSTGLPIFSTEPLTAAEREALRRASRVLRLIADRLDEAVTVNRVDFALQAINRSNEAGLELVAIAARLGSNR